MTGRPVVFLGFAGSLRTGSWNRLMLRAAAECAPAHVRFEIAEIGDVPHYNDDLLAAHGYPAPVERLRRQVAAADAVVIATPEYNYSVPGVLKNALDWISRRPHQPFDGKCAAVIGASRSQMGTSRAQYHLRMILGALNVTVVNHPEVTMAGAHEKFAGDGALTDAAERGRLTDLMARLDDMAARLRRA